MIQNICRSTHGQTTRCRILQKRQRLNGLLRQHDHGLSPNFRIIIQKIFKRSPRNDQCLISH
jgi:hypothetical protein